MIIIQVKIHFIAEDVFKTNWHWKYIKINKTVKLNSLIVSEENVCSETSSVFLRVCSKTIHSLRTVVLLKQGYHMKYSCKRCVLVLQLGSRWLQFICFLGKCVIIFFIALQRNCKLKQFLRKKKLINVKCFI